MSNDDGEDENSGTVYYFHRLEDGSVFRCDHVAKRGCCEDCSRAFRAGNLRGEKQSGGVRGREEIQEKKEEFRAKSQAIEGEAVMNGRGSEEYLEYELANFACDLLDWVRGEVDDL